MRAMRPNGHTLIARKHFTGCYIGDIELHTICLTGMFNDHKGNTSKMMMNGKGHHSTVLGKVLSLTGHQVVPSIKNSVFAPESETLF